MIDVEAAARYPLEDDDWLRTVAIGGLFLFFSTMIGLVGAIVVLVLGALTFGLGLLLFVPLFLVQILLGLPVMGYGIRVLRTTIAGESMPPKFGNWGRLMKDGAYTYGIGIVYAIPMFVLVGILAVVFLGLGLAIDGGGASGALFTLGQLVFTGFVMVWYFVAGYFVPISLSIYASEGSVGAAFSVDRLTQVATNKEYAVPWLIAAVGLLVVNNVASFLTFVVIGALLQFYAIVVAFHLFGEGYAAATESEGATAPNQGSAAESAR